MADTSTQAAVEQPSGTKQSYVYAITIIGILFFIFGFVTWLNGTLIPFLKLACELTTSQALLVTFAFYMAYFFLAIPSSFILQKIGFKSGMALGLFVMAGGALIFIPAATSRTFVLFLTGLFVQGMGLSLLQTASNPYISMIGPIESAAQRISIMGICNKLAGALSPLILSAVILKGASEMEARINAAVNDPALRESLLGQLSHRVIAPYLVMTVVLIALALMIKLSSLPEIDMDGEADATDSRETPQSGRKSIFSFPHLWLGVLCIFVYVGAEVMAGDVIGTYGKYLGMSLDRTKNFTSLTMLFMVIGYVIGIVSIPKYLKQETALKLFAIGGVIFSVGAYLTTGMTSITFVAMLGLANALMWPAIFPMAINGLGRFTKLGSALLIMGIAGGAIIPQVYAGLIEPHSLLHFLYTPSIGFKTAFVLCMIPCYCYILYYAVAGHKVGLAKKS